MLGYIVAFIAGANIGIIIFAIILGGKNDEG